jgi:hypothetical protein
MNEEENLERLRTTGDPQGPAGGQQTEDIISPEEIIVTDTEELKTENLSPEALAKEDNKPKTDQMEVHHHTHAPHGKKTWKAYFWEFLMLFLAVFCGFLAEYQLEHVIEHQREKQYMQSMVKDLESDTLSLNEGFPRKDGRIRAIDSLYDYFLAHPGTNKIQGYVYKLMIRTNYDRSYSRNSVTINQLKNSGGMRLIRKQVVADSLAAYDYLWERSEYWRSAYREHQEAINDFIGEIINDNSLLTYYRNNTSRSPQDNIPDSISFGINTTRLLSYFNYLSRQKAFTLQDKENYQRVAAKAIRLIELIKKEYPLD